MPGKLIILTAPSGSGKTSITKFLLNKYPQLAFSISAATRNPRGKELHGVDYYFMDVDEFQKHIQQNDFIEWEMVYEGKYYGTLKSEIDRIWAEKRTPVLDIDVQGAIHIKKQFPENTLSLFVEPPSVDVLRKRLESRGTETPESLQARISKASYELTFKDEFDHVILNDELEKACAQTEKLIREFLDW
jgi:guanylate kinase